MIREMIASFKRYWAIAPLDKVDALDLTRKFDDTHDIANWRPVPTKEIEMYPGETVYAVTRGPRHTPWTTRKKELEASARQKRRQLESFREEA